MEFDPYALAKTLEGIKHRQLGFGIVMFLALGVIIGLLLHLR